MHKICLYHKSLGIFLSVLIATLLPFQAFAYKPSIITQDLPEAYVGVFYHVQLLIEDFGRKPVWSADGLPDGIELDPVSGILFGATIKSGTFEVLIKVQSGWNRWHTKTDSKLFLLKILPHPDETPADSPAMPDSSANPNAAPEPQSSAAALIAPASDNPASNSQWISITANGESGSETTTALELVFSNDLQINKDNYTEFFEIAGGEAEFDPTVFSQRFVENNPVCIYTFGINIPAKTLQDQTEIKVNIIKLIDEDLVLNKTSMPVKLNIAQADQPEPHPAPEPKPEPDPAPEPDPDLEPDPDPQPEPDPKPQPEPQPESQPQPKPQPEPGPQPPPESSSEASSGILAYSAERNTSSSKSRFKANNTNAVSASSNVGTNGTLSRLSALDELKFAFQTATKSFAVIKTKNAVNVSPKTLKALAAAAKAEGMPAVLHADTVTESRKVDARLYVKPESLTGITEPIKLQISTKGIRPETVKMFFEKHFDNEISVISCEHQGSFGARLQIAAKIKLPEDTGNLVFYSYDASANSFARILTAYRIDSNGYLRFTTEQAGDIIVSNGILKKR